MNRSTRASLVLLAISLTLGACGGSDQAEPEAPLNTDYSALRVATSRDGALVAPKTEAALLDPIKNGVRLSLNPGPSPAAGLLAPATDAQSTYSRTTIQVEGVDEPDLVKYDGRHIYTVRAESVPAKPGLTRSVLKIAKTDPATATLEVTTEFELAGEQNTTPLIYQQLDADGATEFIAAVSQYYQGWFSALPQATMLVVQPDRTTVELLDVRDPYNVSQAWSIELDGWLRGSRKIGNTLYLINSYRPRLSNLQVPDESLEVKRQNERRIRDATAGELLPKFRINGGAAQTALAADDCVIAADLDPNEAYTDLLVISAIDLSSRRVSDQACISTNVNGLYVSRNSLYVGGEGFPGTPLGSAFTVLHKFALDDGEVKYRASGLVGGRVGWLNAAYFMDEHEEHLRIVTSQPAASGNDLHRLSILRETPNHMLTLTAILPSVEHPEPIGKPGEQVHAVRFDRDRAYVVTARVTDPLYAIDVSDPFDPFIAGELEIPGVATFLQPLDADDQRLLLSVGRHTDAAGAPAGVKIELFDVTRLSEVASLGRQIIGAPGTRSEATDNPHALAIATLSGDDVQHRIALPIDVYAWYGAQPSWSHSGILMLELNGNGTQPAQLRMHGMLRTDETSDPGSPPPFVSPRRALVHDNALYAVHGGVYASRFWR